MQGASIAIVSHGEPTDPWAWSGTPDSLRRGFETLGWRPRRASADGSPALTRALALGVRALRQTEGALNWPAPVVALRSRALRGLPLDDDVVLQLGATYRLPRVDATYEDMTIAQLSLRPRLRAGWARRHAETYRRARVCFTASRWAADSVVRDFGVPAEKVVVVGMGANIVCTPRRLPPAPPRYLWVGLEWERKNGRRVVEAFRELAIPGAELHLVGEHPAVDVPGVIGHGRVRDRERLRALFEGATAFVMPSTTEPFGIAYAEAATAGVPSLGTTVGGAADAIGDGGLLVDPHDGRAIREAMAALAQPATHAALAAKAERHGAWARWDGVAERMATALLAA